MKKMRLLNKIMMVVAALFLTTTAFSQTVLTTWTFDVLDAPVPKVIASNTDFGLQQGTAFIYADGTHGSDELINVTPDPQLNTFNGVVINDPRPTTLAGKELAIANQTANGKSIVFTFSTLGYQDPVISFAVKRSATGFNSQLWSVSTDGINFTPATTLDLSDFTSPSVIRSIDLTPFDAIDNQAMVYVKLTVFGSTSGAGNNRLDNIVVSATAFGPDVAAPYVSSFTTLSNTSLKVVFNENVNSTIATTVANYKLDGVNVTNATLANGREVTLTVPSMTEGTTHALLVKNIADLAGNVMVDSTISFSFGLSEAFWAANIAALRAKWTEPLDPNVNVAGTIEYKLTGEAIVTAINDSYRNQVYIQDGDAAIVIDDQNNLIRQGLSLGDKIKNIYGKLTNYFGHLQFVATRVMFDFVSPFNSVTPLVVSLAQFQDINYMNSIQSKVIKLSDISFAATGNFANNGYYKLNQNGASRDSVVWIHFYNIAGITGSPIPTGITNITGVCKITRNNYRIVPTSANAFIGITNVVKLPVIIAPNPATDYVNISSEENINVEIYNLTGQMIYTSRLTIGSHNISVSNFNSGLYLIRMTNDAGVVNTSKLIVQ
ncbi:MAG: T9SS type A sorting domain-containing protein [Bacteroidales bacterium]|jgi:hypothetical protein|nr:T9SS type A sorting domain-containing protein [Bacteroidales bacterium]